MCQFHKKKGTSMTKDEALKMALEYVELVPDDRYNAEHIDREALITAIKEALAQPEQEPVAFASHGVVNWIADKQFQHEADLYTTPQRTWVGLTEDDKVLIKHDANFNQFMTAGEYADRVQQLTEARLKDLNT